MLTLHPSFSRKAMFGAAFVLVMTLATAASVGHREATQLRAANEEKAIALAHSLASIIEQKLHSYVQMIDVASLTHAQRTGTRLEVLESIARATRSFDGFATLMRDMGGSIELVRPVSAAGRGAAVRIAPTDKRFAPFTDMLRRARATNTPQVSEVYFSEFAGRHVVAVATGALDSSPWPEQFVIHIPFEVFGELLAENGVGQGIFSALSDATGEVVARSDHATQYVGKKAPDWFLRARSGRESGIVSGAPLPGNPLPSYEFAFHRLEGPQGWYVTLAFPPGVLRPGFVVGTETLAWGALAFLLSLLVVWAALGRDIRAAQVKRRADAATRDLLRGLPGALFQIALPQGENPRVIVSHGTLAADLTAGAPEGLDAVLQGAVAGSRSGGLPQDVAEGGRTLRIFASGRGPENGAPGLLQAYVLDVTELKRAEATAAASTRLAAVGEIYASIAHEISQPLNIISLAAENGSEFLKEGDAGAAASKFSGIVRQAMQARRIIDRLLVFARGEPAQGRLTRVDLAGCLANARELVEAQLRQNQVVMRVDAPAGAIRVLAAPLELEHVFLNVLLNAIYAIAEQASAGERLIEVRVRASHGEATVEIEDTGGGIAPELIAHAFEPFMTTKPRGAGTGLGLSFVQGAMKSFGGRAEIGNGPRGARVRLSFRRVAAAAA